MKYKCQKCGKIWYGWAQADICPDCGGKSETVEDEKEEEKKTKENVKKIVRFK